jgi:S1-C subfamily serine protease
MGKLRGLATGRSLARYCRVLVVSLVVSLPQAVHAELSKTIPAIKPSVVGVGSMEKTRSPAVVFFGTGFVVGDGLSIITNAHVLPKTAGWEGKEELGIVVKDRHTVAFRRARLIALDREHDLAHLRFEGEPMPALRLSEPDRAVEGDDLAFTGFPLGMALGLHAVTHRATLSAITPIVTPALNSGKLDVRTIAQLQHARFDIYQLDGTAYPGNSGSPVYDPDTGVVHAVLNKVFVNGLKETAISQPSGITYAIPVRHVHSLLQRK